jgi:hypothetical protein
MSGCTFKLASSFASTNDVLVRISYGLVSGCRFDLSNNGSGTVYGVRAPVSEVVSRPITVTGCSFNASGASGTVNFLGNGSINSIYEEGNSFGSSGTPYSGFPIAGTSSAGAFSSAQGSSGSVWVTATGSITLEYDRYGAYLLQANNDFSAVTVGLGNNIAPGRDILFAVWNKSGTNWVPSLPGGSGTVLVRRDSGLSIGTLNNNNVSIFVFRIIYMNGSRYAFMTSAIQNVGV